ncbi:MAG: Na+/H+ antiporter subunit E [Caldilineaceae bacterium]
MATDTPIRSERLSTFFLINLLAAVVLPWFFTLFGGLWDHSIAFVAAYIVLGLVDRSYLRAVFWGVVFILYLLWEIVLSNINIAWLVIQPRPKLDPGIIGVPLRLTSGLEITMLASAITLTPGTISVDLASDETGNRILFVHNLQVGDPEAYRESVHSGFERMILRVTRGG